MQTIPFILFEDNVLLVCNKPSGLMVEPDRNNYPNLLQQVKDYLKTSTGEKSPYVQHLHRLDRPTSGIVLFTKKREHLKDLSEQFAQRHVVKKYIALTKNAPAQMNGVLEHWHRKEKKKAVLVPEGTPFSEKAKLEYIVKAEGDFFKWEIILHTGKYHQIRIQLSSLGCPIFGDTIYGSTEPYKPNSIALHASALTIKHPTTLQQLSFETAFNI